MIVNMLLGLILLGTPSPVDSCHKAIAEVVQAPTPIKSAAVCFPGGNSYDGELTRIVIAAVQNGLGDAIITHPDDPESAWAFLLERAPTTDPRIKEVLAQVLTDEGFGPHANDGRWGASDFSNDGFYVASEGADNVQVVATAFLRQPVRTACDAVRSIKKTECDYRAYPSWAGLERSYAEVTLQQQSTLGYSTVRKVRYQIDVAKWPDPKIDVFIRDLPQEAGGWLCEYNSAYPFSGCDRFIPVSTSSAKFVCLLVVTEYSGANALRTVRENLGSLVYLSEEAERRVSAVPAGSGGR